MQFYKDKIMNKKSKISKQSHIVELFGENGDIQYNCTSCHKTFGSRSQKYYHLNCNQLQHMMFKCEHCDKSFARQSQWKYHIESHRSPINECNKCQKTFSNPIALKKHVGLHKVQPKQCPHCDKTFKKNTSLDDHIAAQHLNQLQYGCALCSKKYASKSTLQLHLHTHEAKRFECSFCGKFFQRNSILNLHLKRHYKTNNYICPVCQKVFTESGALARHRKIHEENVIQYHCKLCDKNILRKDNMTRHLNTIHPDEKLEDILEIIRPPMTKPINEPSFKASEETIICNSNENIMEQPEKPFVIIENKLLQKPYELKDSIIDLPKAHEIATEEYPLINQIKVITSAPTYTKMASTSHERIQQYKIMDHEKFVDTRIQENNTNCDLDLLQSNLVEQNAKRTFSYENPAHLTNVHNRTKVSESLKKQINIPSHDNEENDIENLNQNASEISDEIPKTVTVSSVIRSIGNVKKHLTSSMVNASKPPRESCMEYQHKKYCRTNYNIDLYRKILGCDDDENDGDNDKLQHNSFPTHSELNLSDDHMTKSSTPVHWRKSFKNNYETKSF